jgi:hypothetical protein
MLRSTLVLLAASALGCSGAVETSTGSTGSNQQGGPSPSPSSSSSGGSANNGSDGSHDAGAHDSSPSTNPGHPDASPSTEAGSTGECQPGTVQSCTQSDGSYSIQSCDETNGTAAWGTCGALNACSSPQSCTTAGGQPGASCDGSSCVAIGECDPTNPGPPPTSGICLECPCVCLVSGGQWSLVSPPCNTPLVLAFEEERVEFTRASGNFDIVGGELSVDTDWVGASTPWLAMDLDGNGAIDDGRELFGSMTELPDGSRARNGFEALAALDADGDGRITAKDPAFAHLVVWRDADQDRRSSARELQPASAAGLVAIDLAYRNVPRCTGGSCEVERAHFVFRDAAGQQREGAVIDVHLATR